MHDLDDQLSTRLRALADPLDDADWLDVRRRAGRAAPPRRRRLPLPRLVAACVAAAAAITAAVQLLPGGHEAGRVPGLDAVAARAAAAPSTVPGPGEYAYTKLRYGIDREAQQCTEEWWIGPDGSGRLIQHGAICARSGDDRRFGPGGALRRYTGMHGNAFHGDPADLPTEPEPLERALEETLRGLRDFTPEVLADPVRRSDAMLDVIAQVLANPFAAPELRGALYRVAAGLEGMRVEEGVIDPAGRSGSAITIEHAVHGSPEKRELIFDPVASATLAERETYLRPDGRPRTVGALAYLERGIVGSVGARP